MLEVAKVLKLTLFLVRSLKSLTSAFSQIFPLTPIFLKILTTSTIFLFVFGDFVICFVMFLRVVSEVKVVDSLQSSLYSYIYFPMVHV